MTSEKRLTWSTPDGCWGIHGAELEGLPPSIYGALCKLRDMESTIERLNDPAVEGWEAEELMRELMAAAPWEPDPNGVEWFDGRRWRAC